MHQSWLIQRLLPPFENAAENRGKPTPDMVFGGARDLTQEQHDAICDLFRLDSMGSAHFEFGAIPNALYRLATNKSIRAYQVDMALNPTGGTLSHLKLTPKMQTIYVLTTPETLSDTLESVQSLAQGNEQGLKREANVGLSIFLDEIAEKRSWAKGSKKNVGWHDIENDFLFFTDKTMFDGIRERFEIEGDVTTLPQIGTLKTKAPRRKKSGPDTPNP